MRQFSRIIGQASRSVSNQVRNGSSYSSSIKPVTMNEMPVPSGSWSEHYNAKQKAYNMHLMIGLALAAVSVVAGIQTGGFFLNMGPDLKNKK